MAVTIEESLNMGSLMRLARKNQLVDTFFKLKGNTKVCIWTEPLWGVPYNLYRPYVTRFMIAMGLSMTDIGMITTIALVVEIIFSALSGVLSDKLGRRKCTVIFDTLSWSVPELLWAFSQNFTWFAVAALFNGMWKVTENSWNLLLTEDAPREHIVPAFSMASFMGVVAVFVAPLSKFAVDAFGLVPTMRVLYFIAFVSMTTKFMILYRVGTETRAGVQRMALTKNRSVISMLWECKDVYLRIIREKRMLLTLAILAIYALITATNDNCWATFVVEYLGLKDSDLSWFAMLKGGVTLASILMLAPRLKSHNFRNPMLFSLAMFAGAQALLLATDISGMTGAGVWLMLILCVAMEATAVAVLSPLTQSLLFINADPDERARVCGMVFATVALMVCVFPAIIGYLADISLYLPFAINIGLFCALGVCTVLISRLPAPEEQ